MWTNCLRRSTKPREAIAGGAESSKASHASSKERGLYRSLRSGFVTDSRVWRLRLGPVGFNGYSGPFVGTIDMTTGIITPIVTGLSNPGGLVFVDTSKHSRALGENEGCHERDWE